MGGQCLSGAYGSCVEECGFDSPDSEYGPVVVSCEHGHAQKFLDCLRVLLTSGEGFWSVASVK